MSTDTPLINSMAWLVALQFLLYATGWLLSSLLLREERTAVLCWAGFLACIGLGFLLTAQRGEPRTWLAFNGSGLAFMGGLVLLWVGLDAFYRRLLRPREPVLTFALLALVLGLIDPGVAAAPLRVVFTYAALIYLAVRLVIAPRQLGTGSDERRSAWLNAIPGVLIIVAFSVPLFRQLANMDRALEIHRFDATNLRSMYLFTAAAAVFNFGFMAMVTRRLLTRLRDLSNRDPLTSLLNRRALEEDLQREWRRWQRTGQAFAVVVLDLDHFKHVNDSLGHAVGDEVLVQTAQRLLAQARKSDSVARIGGEEFLVLMPEANGAGALAAAERLRRAIADLPYDHTGQPLVVTVSIGLAEAGPEDVDVLAPLRRADAALYEAKRNGRNRVVVAPASPASRGT
jgi:diguanylate cyclase (GGDEF)-like protein